METAQRKKMMQDIERIVKEHGVVRASVYGSFARGEDDEKSDVDILVELPEGSTIFDLVGLEQELSESLHKEVDIATYRSVNPRIKEYVYADAIEIV